MAREKVSQPRQEANNSDRAFNALKFVSCVLDYFQYLSCFYDVNDVNDVNVMWSGYQ